MIFDRLLAEVRLGIDPRYAKVSPDLYAIIIAFAERIERPIVVRKNGG